jgi:hypothetical protein
LTFASTFHHHLQPTGKRDFVSQSTPDQAEDRVVLFQRNGELSEFADLLSDLAVSVEDCHGALPDPLALEGARLVVISGRRLLESGAPNLSLWPRTIAVIDDSSRTLVTHLSRAGVAMVIRRPIHPRTLRLLLLHEVYRGPERRKLKRILIGHPIRVGSGLFKAHATLLELSATGARIELANAPKIGSKIRILMGKDLTKGKPIKLQAKVVRAIRYSGGSSRTESEIGVALLDANRYANVIKKILDRFALGPAPWQPKGRNGDSSGEITAASLPTPSSLAAKKDLPLTHSASELQPNAPELKTLPPTRELPESTQTLDSNAKQAEADEISTPSPELQSPPTEMAIGAVVTETIEVPPAELQAANDSGNEDTDRRRERRVPYERRIVALSEEAARVLVGRDLSRGGMRIAATSSIAVGDVLRVALHSGIQTEPIVVVARATRDDGDAGLVLSFDNLSDTQSSQLEKIIASSLPVQTSIDDFNSSSHGVVVVETIETIEQAHEPTKGVETDDEVEAHLDSVFDTDHSVEDAP